MSQYFPKEYSSFDRNVKTKIGQSNYAKKAELKGATGIDTSTLASKTDLACLNTKVDYLYLDKLKTILADLSKLRNVVSNDVVKKIVHERFITKVSAIDTKKTITGGLVTKLQCNSDKQSLEKNIGDADKKIPNTSGL